MAQQALAVETKNLNDNNNNNNKNTNTLIIMDNNCMQVKGTCIYYSLSLWQSCYGSISSIYIRAANRSYFSVFSPENYSPVRFTEIDENCTDI